MRSRKTVDMKRGEETAAANVRLNLENQRLTIELSAATQELTALRRAVDTRDEELEQLRAQLNTDRQRADQAENRAGAAESSVQRLLVKLARMRARKEGLRRDLYALLERLQSILPELLWRCTGEARQLVQELAEPLPHPTRERLPIVDLTEVLSGDDVPSGAQVEVRA